MPNPDRQQYIDQQLNDVAMAYYQVADNFIAPKVFPILPVDKQEAKYYIFNKADNLRDDMQRRSNASESAGSGFNLSQDSYHCDVFALHKDVTTRDRKNWTLPSLTLDDATAQWLAQQGLQRMERQWATDFFTTSVWTATGSDTTPTSGLWSVYATSDPLADVDAAKTVVLKETGFEPNTLVLGYEVWQKLKRHPLIVDRVTGGATTANPGNVTRQAVAAILEVENLYVAKAAKQTQAENETAVAALVHGKHALLCYTNPTPSLVAPSCGYTFFWRDVDYGGSTVTVARIPMPHLGVGTERLEIQKSWDNKATGSDLGFFWSDAVA